MRITSDRSKKKVDEFYNEKIDSRIIEWNSHGKKRIPTLCRNAFFLTFTKVLIFMPNTIFKCPLNYRNRTLHTFIST